MRKNFITQVYDLKEKSYNGLKETTNMKSKNEQCFYKFHMQNYYTNKSKLLFHPPGRNSYI